MNLLNPAWTGILYLVAAACFILALQGLGSPSTARRGNVIGAVGAVIGRWGEIVGPEIALHCAPLDFVGGVLTVRADSTAWATQLRLLSSSLLARLAQDVGEGTVTEIRVVGPGAPSWSRGQRRVQDGRGPRDTYG